MQSKTTSIFRLFSLFSKIQKGYQVIIVGNQRYEIKTNKDIFFIMLRIREDTSQSERRLWIEIAL
jgi:hypothetical protein